MHCKHCDFLNGEDDHRCLRCGRRVAGIVIAAPPGYSGANALAPSLVFDNDTQEFQPVQPAAPVQAALFPSPSGNVIPFDRRQREAAARQQAQSSQPTARFLAPPAKAPAAQRTAQRGPSTEQGTLDFIPPAPLRGRKLKNDVDAQIFCDQPVATPTHRLVAASIDMALILLGFGVIVLTSQLLGGSFGTGMFFWLSLAGALAAVSMLYGLIWAIAGTETAGMRFTDLQLITFDGFPVDARSRALRFASTWLSFCSGGLGLLWAVADEENLTWHDHISKTFPTIREEPRTFVKQRQ